MNDFELGKFGSVDELLRAYNNLHSAFTKKCQQYSAIKKQLEDLKQGQIKTQEQTKTQQHKISDNLLPPAQDNGTGPEIGTSEKSSEQNEIDRFFDRFPQAIEFAYAIGQALDTSEPTFDDLMQGFILVLTDKIHEPQKLLKDKNFLNEFVYCDEDIRQYFIKDYLSRLTGINVPQSIESMGVISVLPPVRPKNLKDARNLAREILSKKGEN